MARIRTIKPEFFTSDDVCALSPLARLLFIGCWCEADREGRMEWKPSTLKRKYLPEDDCDADEICNSLVDKGLIVIYGQGLALVTGFARHQVINLREAQSKLPEPQAVTGNACALPAIAPGKGREGKGREGKREDHSTSRKTRSAEPRGTRLPEDSQPTPEDRAFAADLGLNAQDVWDEFRDYWCAVPGAKGRKLDWSKTFHNRCRELAKRPVRAAPKSFAQQATDRASSVVNHDALGQWRARCKDWQPGKFWLEHDWGPEPFQPGCRVPRSILEEISQ